MIEVILAIIGFIVGVIVGVFITLSSLYYILHKSNLQI